jgi:hypothetical protein
MITVCKIMAIRWVMAYFSGAIGEQDFFQSRESGHGG